MQDPYRFKWDEKGRFSLYIFNYGTPIVNNDAKGSLNNKQDLENLKMCAEKYNLKPVLAFLDSLKKEFITIGNDFSKKLNKDFN